MSKSALIILLLLPTAISVFNLLGGVRVGSFVAHRTVYNAPPRKVVTGYMLPALNLVCCNLLILRVGARNKTSHIT